MDIEDYFKVFRGARFQAWLKEGVKRDEEVKDRLLKKEAARVAREKRYRQITIRGDTMSCKESDAYIESMFEIHLEECDMCHNNKGSCIERIEDCEEHSKVCTNDYCCHEDCEHCKYKVKRQGDLL